MSQGWTWGPLRDDASKEHPCLVPYAELPEIEKEYDRSTARAVISATWLLITVPKLQARSDEAEVQANGTTMSKHELFLSYGRSDAKDIVDKLRYDLEARGYEVWQDSRSIRAGKSWEDNIVDGLYSAEVVVAFLGPHAVVNVGEKTWRPAVVGRR